MSVARTAKIQEDCIAITHAELDSTVDVGYGFVSPYFDWKRLLDIALSLLLIIPGGLIVGLLICLVRLTSRGPGLYCQTRVTRQGQPFKMYKIRTMRCDAEARSGPVWTSDKDNRITPVGHVLRKAHLDELPQLWNILRGEMSLVGPRPERPEFVSVLDAKISGYTHRHAVRPGVTGLAQINLPPDTDLDSVRKKLVLDLEYIQRGSLGMDLRILACTLLRMFGSPAAPVIRLLGLHREVILDDGTGANQQVIPLRVLSPNEESSNQGNGHQRSATARKPHYVDR